MVDPNDDPIELQPSAAERWRTAFHDERERIEAVVETIDGPLKRIEHVGATAVRGLRAKPIVDLDIVVADDAVERVARLIADDLGGTQIENSDGWQPVFRRHNGQRFNDHVFGIADDGWKISVVTRDVLRANEQLQRDYERTKRELATATDDLTEYSRGKTPIIERLLATAAEEDHYSYPFEIPALDAQS